MEVFIIRAKVFNLIRNLGMNRERKTLLKALHNLCFQESQPAFVDHLFIFLFQFHENGIIWRCRLITADTEFFFVYWLFKRIPNQPIGFCIIIDISNRGASILVELHIRLHCLQNRRFFGGISFLL